MTEGVHEESLGVACLWPAPAVGYLSQFRSCATLCASCSLDAGPLWGGSSARARARVPLVPRAKRHMLRPRRTPPVPGHPDRSVRAH